MIGAAGQDGDRAIDLLGQHRPHQGVGPGLNPKGQTLAGDGQDRSVQAVGPADDQGQATHAVVAQLGDAPGEGAGGQGLAMFIAGDQMGAGQRS